MPRLADRHEVTVTFVLDTSDGDLDGADFAGRLDRVIDGLPKASLFVQRDATYENRRLTLEFRYKRPRGV